MIECDTSSCRRSGDSSTVRNFRELYHSSAVSSYCAQEITGHRKLSLQKRIICFRGPCLLRSDPLASDRIRLFMIDLSHAPRDNASVLRARLLPRGLAICVQTRLCATTESFRSSHTVSTGQSLHQREDSQDYVIYTGRSVEPNELLLS